MQTRIKITEQNSGLKIYSVEVQRHHNLSKETIDLVKIFSVMGLLITGISFFVGMPSSHVVIAIESIFFGILILTFNFIYFFVYFNEADFKTEAEAKQFIDKLISYQRQKQVGLQIAKQYKQLSKIKTVTYLKYP